MFALYIDSEFTKEISAHSFLTIEIEKKINEKISNSNFGGGIDSCSLRILCVNPVFDKVRPVLPPKLRSNDKFIVTARGEELLFGKNFEFDTKIDFEAMLVADEKKAKELIFKSILSALPAIDEYKRKPKTFDSELYKKTIAKAVEELVSEL